MQGQKIFWQAYIFAIKSIKRAKQPHFGNKKAIIPIFFVSILWFLYGADEGTRTHMKSLSPEPESGASANSATSAYFQFYFGAAAPRETA